LGEKSLRASQVLSENANKKTQIEDLFLKGNLMENIEGNLNVTSEIGVILPTYNEAVNIEKLIYEIDSLNLNVSILVIDDSSPDGTPQIVRNLQKRYSSVLLFQRPFKKGLGTAVTEGFKIFLSFNCPPKYVITMDADFSHNPEDIPRLVQLAKKGYDLVIGGRYCVGGRTERWGPFRVLISRIANVVASIVLGAKIPDCTSGLRCYSSNLLKGIVNYLHSETYEIQIETVRQAVKRGFYVTFLPITFVNRKLGKSKLTFNEMRQFLSYILKAKIEDLIKS